MTLSRRDAAAVLQPRSRRASRWLQHGATAVLWSLVALAAYSASVPVWFRLHGWQVVTLVSGSMSPEYPTGTDLILESVGDPSGVNVGQVITVSEGAGLPVTHRVVQRIVLPTGVAYRMKGDANTSPDPMLVPADRVIGRIQRAVPGWTAAAVWIERTNARFVVFGLPLTWLLAMELSTFVHEWKGRVRARKLATAAGVSRDGDLDC